MPKITEAHRAKMRETILDAAIKIFSKQGYAMTKVDDVASTANVSKGTVYLYFASKEELYESIVKETRQILAERQNELFKNKKDIEADLGKFYDSFSKTVRPTSKLKVGAIAESGHNLKLKKILQKNKKDAKEKLIYFLQSMKKMGYFRNDTSIEALASGIIAVFDGLLINESHGMPTEENKKICIKTIMAIFEGSKTV